MKQFLEYTKYFKSYVRFTSSCSVQFICDQMSSHKILYNSKTTQNFDKILSISESTSYDDNKLP